MLRSLDYAAWSAWQRRAGMAQDAGAGAARVEAWRAQATRAFRDSYAAAGGGLGPADEALLDLFLVQKAVYEVGYELASRPDWVTIPLRGLIALADA